MAHKQTAAIPHSWAIQNWPAEVHPGNATKGRYVVRTNRDELMREGALSSVGRELVILGDRYARWLEKRTSAVPGYEIAANRSRPEATA